MSDDGCDVTYKVLLLGDASVGKTSLLKRLTGSGFVHGRHSTVGIDFVKATFVVDGAKVALQIWDTAGQERFRSMTRCQYHKTKGLLLVYDVTDRTSFDALGYWLHSIDQDLDKNNKEPVPVVIIGNKCDVRERRKVTHEEGKKMADRHLAVGFWETSALSGHHVYDCFAQLAHTVTDVYNPELMDMYKYSKAVDRTWRWAPESDVDKSSQTKTIKLSKEKKRIKLKCECK